MRRPRILGVVALAALATASHAQQSLTGGSQPGIDVLHYEFRVDFPLRPFPDTLQFVSTAVARRTARVQSVSLDLTNDMQVQSVTVNGATAPFRHDSAKVRVTLAAATGDTLRIVVRYRGAPKDGLIIRRDSTGGYWTAFGDNFPDRARQWLATVDHPSDKATVEWIVRAPQSHRVVANGELLEETPELQAGGAPGMQVTRWRTARPLYTAVMVIGVAPFATYELGKTACNLAELPGCVQQSVWITPDVRSYMPGPFARVGEMVSLFSQLVAPFPYEKLAHVQSSTRYGGMENASAIFYADNIYRRRSMSEGLLAHEIAHQWFGDAVTTREWPHVWLSEGFATYFAALWFEHSAGDSAFRANLAQMRRQVLGSRATNDKPIIDLGLDDLGRVLNSNVYQKAGFTLHMLRREIGDSAFYRGIRSYYRKYRHGNALTEDFQREVEASSGRKLDWFFDQWMRRPGVADLTVQWRWDARRRGVELTVSQNPAFAPYQLSLTMDVMDARGRAYRTRASVPPARVATLLVPLRIQGAPASIVFDPDSSILGKITVP